MPWADYTRNTYTVQVIEWAGNNLELIEAVLGVDVISVVDGLLYISSGTGRVLIPAGDNIIATMETLYDVGPPVVNFVPGVFLDVVTDAELASDYTIVP